MNRKHTFTIVLFTVFVCSVFVFLNPVLCSDLGSENFSEGEIFLPSNGTFDFGDFRINDSQIKNFTVKYADISHVLLVDETGDKVINVIQMDKMINLRKSYEKSFINGELQKTGWMVDGVEIHEIEFSKGDNLYSACVKDISSGKLIYIATPSDNETAAMINSLSFNK